MCYQIVKSDRTFVKNLSFSPLGRESLYFTHRLQFSNSKKYLKIKEVTSILMRGNSVILCEKQLFLH